MQHSSSQQESPPAHFVYSLPSIVERIDLTDLFPTPQPLEIELGSGDGSFLLYYAEKHPERNFIGVERLKGRIRKLDRKGRRLGLRNLRGIRIESVYFLTHLVPLNSTDAFHIYFPDPWPKAKHRKNRIINERFPSLAKRALRPGGLVHLRTDDEDYFEQMREAFSNATAFQKTETPHELLSIQTDFQNDFAAQGTTVHTVSYRLNG